MKSYRMVWAGAWAVVLVPLCLLGMVVGDAAVVLILTALAAALVAALVERRHHRRWAVEVAAAVGVTTATVYAIGALPALGLLMLMVITFPPTVRRAAAALLKGRARRPAHLAAAQSLTEEVRAGAPLGSDAFAGMVQTLDNHELIAAWRQSHEVLGYTNLVDLRLQLIALRQAYLDEMERRHPAGFAAWMEAGATRDPERFLTPGRTRELE